MDLDNWQREVLETSGNLVLRSGRQVGKSTCISIKVSKFATSTPNKTVLVIASVERQAYLLFEKILAYIHDHHRNLIMRGKNRPTKSKILLRNGSTIYCLPTGLSGYGIRGYTVDLLVADEAAFIPEEVWSAVTPMLAVTKGSIILLSTPFGKGGYFFRCFDDPNFTKFHISSEECPRISPEFLEQEKKRMTALQYAQEYLGEFVDELRQFFSPDLIRSCMTLSKDSVIPTGTNYLGVDVARMGRDDTVLFSLSHHKQTLYQRDLKITNKTLLTQTVNDILHYDKVYNYRNIYIDDGGMGVGVFDPLLVNPQTRRKVIPINNASRSLEPDWGSHRKRRLMKEDLYNNLLSLMEQNRIKLMDDPDVAHSLKSVQAEYNDDRLRIFGAYTHIAEALIRAAWCVKSKSLNIYLY